MNRNSFSTYLPRERLRISDWAEKNIMVPVGNARPGPISFKDMPYQRQILDAVQDPAIRRITIMSGAQIGKTLIAISLIGYYTLHEPRSQMYMQPSEPDLQKWLASKFEPIVDANDRFKKAYVPARGTEGPNNQIIKSFRTGFLTMAWAGSGNALRGMSAPVLFCDEVDGYEYSEEGHPVDILWQRSGTFGESRKLIELSTPKIEGVSRIQKSFENGDQRHFHVCCTQCTELFIFNWEQVRWDGEDVETAKIHCPICDSGYDDAGRIALCRQAIDAGGGFIASEPTLRHASFHLPALYSPLHTLPDIVDVYLTTKKDYSENTFTNTILGLPAVVGTKVDEDDLSGRCENYQDPVPDGVLILTAGIDVQGDRLECEIVGWGLGEESWNIDYQIFHGPTDDLASRAYKEFVDYLNKGFQGANQSTFFVCAAAIDSGFNTKFIYDFVDRYQNRVRTNLIPIKGIAGWKREDVKYSRAKKNAGIRTPALWTLAVDKLKETVMKRFARTDKGPGYCHFPIERLDSDYFRQLASETLIVNPKTGRLRWEQSGKNEALDCRVYAYGALRIVSPDFRMPLLHGKNGYYKPNQKPPKPRKRRAAINILRG